MAQDLAQSAHISRRFVAVLVLRATVKDSEKVIVRTSDDFTAEELLWSRISHTEIENS